MPLLVRMPERACGTTRIREVVGPARPGQELRHIYLGFVRMRQGQRRGFDFGPMDTVAVVLSGAVEAAWEDVDGKMRQETVEGRGDVFDGPPWAVCARPYTTLFIKGVSEAAELALVRAELIEEKAGGGSHGAVQPGVEIVTPKQVQVQAITPGACSMEIRGIAAVACPRHAAGNVMMVGETLISGIGAEAGDQVAAENGTFTGQGCEEVRHFRLKPASGSGIQRVYSSGYDHVYVIHDLDTVAIPVGFRPDPAAAAPGHELYCLWAVAGSQQLCALHEPGALWRGCR